MPHERQAPAPPAVTVGTFAYMAPEQTGRVEADLRRCLAEWESLGRIDPFTLGMRDTSDRLAVPERVYVESAPERFDAVITDEVMPGITGTALAARLHRRRAGLPIVLVSGYIAPMLAERAHAAGATEILRKPVQSREFAQLC